MEVHELLDSRAHGDLRLETRRKPYHFIRVVPAEFGRAAAVGPLLFSKNSETGAFYAGLMLGFRPEEILTDAVAPDAFWPLEMVREGFFTAGENIAIDRNHPRFGDDGDSPLFESDGTPSLSLQRVQRALGQLVRGSAESEAFIAALLEHRLIEPIDISLRFDDGERMSLDGLYSIGLDTLSELDDAAALALFRSGHLQLAYVMIASLQHIPLLARKRNERLADAV
ncbi:SapC family protein [Sphingobium ummariense]